MRDVISISRRILLHPKLRDRYIAFIEEAEERLNITLRMAQGLRTFAEQDAVYAQGRTTPGKIVTYSPAGTSYHNYGLAGDEVIVRKDGSIDWNYDYNKIVPFAEKYDLQCGINFPHKDSDHFEDKMGLNWRDMLHKYQMKDFIPGTIYINI